MNKLLLRQVRKHYDKPENIPAELASLLEVISESYEHYEKDRNMLERSIELNSNEMIWLNDKLRKETAEVKTAHFSLNTLFENIQEVFFTMDVTLTDGKPCFKTVHISPACMAVYGYERKDFYENGVLWREVALEEDKKIIDSHFPLLLKGKSIAFEYRIIHKNGSIRWISTKITPTLNEAGTIIRIDGVTNDINEKKLSEKRLEDAHHHLNTIFNNLDAVVYSVDMVTYTLTQISAACEKVYGFTSNDFYTQPDLWEKVIHPDDKHISYIQVETLAKGQQVFNQYRIIHKDGNIRWIENKIIPTLDDTGRLIRLDGVTNDITSKRESAQKLQESEMRFRTLIENSADMLTLINAEGRIFYESPSVEKTLGYAPGENIGREALNLVFPDDIPKAGQAFEQLANTRDEPLFVALRLKSKKGENFFIEGHITNMLHVEGINALVCNFRDVTQRIVSEKTLAEIQNRYKMVFDNPILGIAIGTIDGTMQNVNDAFCKMLGYTREELYNQHFSIYTLPEDTENERPYILKMANGELDTYQIEKRYITKSNALIWVELSISCVKNAANEVEFVVAVVQDITPKKTAEESLYKSEANLRNILENTDTAYALLNNDAIILSCNNIARKLSQEEFGEPLEEGKNYVDMMREDRRKGVRATIQTVLTSKKPVKYETKYVNPGKPDKWLLVSMYPILDVNKNVLGLSVAALDISNGKNTEQLIKQSNDRYELVTKATNDVIWDWDITNSKLYRSENYKQVFGYSDSVDNAYTQSEDSHIHADDRLRIISSIQQKIRETNASFWEDEYRYYRENQELAYVQDRGYIIYDEDKKPVRMVGAMRDITAEKIFAIERDKITSDLIRQNKNLEQFAYIVSHNLRAPIANISGLLGILQTPELEAQTKKRSMEGLSTSVKKLDGVIIDLSDILQVKREINEKREDIRFSSLLEDIKLSVRNFIEKENVTILTDFSTPGIFTVKSYMYSIFYNLISNSIKYKDPDRKPIITITSRETESKIILKFSDNGSGIDLSLYGDKIFGLYKRFHYDVEGRGMGLFMVKTQVESLEGNITVSSQINKGTTFTIEFEKKSVAIPLTLQN